MNNTDSDNCETCEPCDQQIKEIDNEEIDNKEIDNEEDILEVEKDWEIKERKLFQLTLENNKKTNNIIKALSILKQFEFESDSELGYEEYSSEDSDLENECNLCDNFCNNLVIMDDNIKDKTKSVEIEPTKSVEIEPTKSVEIEPTKSVEIEPTKSVEIEPNKFEEIEPTKSVEIEPTKSVEIEPTKSENTKQKKGRTKNEDIEYNFWVKDLNDLDRLEWREYKYKAGECVKFWKYTIRDNKFLSNTGKLNTKGTYFQKSFNNKNEIDKYINKQIKIKKLN